MPSEVRGSPLSVLGPTPNPRPQSPSSQGWFGASSSGCRSSPTPGTVPKDSHIRGKARNAVWWGEEEVLDKPAVAPGIWRDSDLPRGGERLAAGLAEQQKQRPSLGGGSSLVATCLQWGTWHRATARDGGGSVGPRGASLICRSQAEACRWNWGEDPRCGKNYPRDGLSLQSYCMLGETDPTAQ